MSRPQESLQRAQETIRQLYAELEQTNQEVLALTLELEQRVDALRKEVAERKKAESERQAQVDRLSLLNQITRAIDERQDLRSILQVAVRSLEEHLPLDFAAACLSEPAQPKMTIASLGCRAVELAVELGLHEHGDLQVDIGSPCQEALVCESDTQRSQTVLARQLVAAGLHSLVIVPLRAEGKAFGALLAARRKVAAFEAGEQQFIVQLSEHVALAAHQAMLHGALEQAYEDIRRTQQAVLQQERLRALGQLAGGIAHDINNALSPAALYLETLLERDSSLSGTAREYLTVVNRAIESVGHTVARMRMFYRPRQPEITLSPVDLNRTLQEVTELTRARWSDIPQERGILVHLQSDLAPELPPVLGAENEIRDGLTNLLLNAVDAMPEGGTLTLRSGSIDRQRSAGNATSHRAVFVEIGDTGIGMSEDTRSRCLEPFFTTKGERGTGLGLAMVYGMTQRHGAELEIDSTPGKGTVVRLIFPIAYPATNQQPSGPASALTALRILLVDDDPLLLQSLRDILESEGHSITTADGGQRGIDEFLAAHEHGEPFAVVITDLGMPNVNGRAVAAAIKTVAPDVPVILLTGWGQQSMKETELAQHVDRVLGKPPRLTEVRSALADLVSEPRRNSTRTPGWAR